MTASERIREARSARKINALRIRYPHLTTSQIAADLDRYGHVAAWRRP